MTPKRVAKYRHRATVEKSRPRLVGDIVTRERAALPCGCCIHIGVVEGPSGWAPSSRSQACSDNHQPMIELADQLFREDTARPRPGIFAVNAAAAVLTSAAREMGI